ncbi:MAG: hypothetical protein HC845_12840 [Akkermansiaceae bacterium]|nr:hypothetical protein [Akkermansiaceae bacterium]
MEKTIEVINRLQATGLIGVYAIGGAVAAAYYVEPTVTYDLDIFTFIPGSSFLIDLSPIYKQLKAWDYQEQGAGVEIEGWEVQFLVPPGPLEEAALKQAVATTFHHIPTRIMTAEFLCAIMLKTGRPKDLIRLSQFLEEKVLNKNEFMSITDQFYLRDKWDQFLLRNYNGQEPQFSS